MTPTETNRGRGDSATAGRLAGTGAFGHRKNSAANCCPTPTAKVRSARPCSTCLAARTTASRCCCRASTPRRLRRRRWCASKQGRPQIPGRRHRRPFAEPDTLRADSHLLVTVTARGGLTCRLTTVAPRCRFWARSWRTALWFRPSAAHAQQSNSLLDGRPATKVLQTDGDIRLGCLVGYDKVIVKVPSTKKRCYRGISPFWEPRVAANRPRLLGWSSKLRAPTWL